MKRLLAIAVLMLLASTAFAAGPPSPSAPAPAVTLPDYIDALEHMHALLKANQLVEAQREATALMNHDVLCSRGHFAADASLLGAVAATTRADRALLDRIELTVAELRANGEAASAPDPKLLQRVAAEQETPELAPGGEVKSPVLQDAPLFERVARSIADAFRWMRKKFRQFVDWLLDFFPSSEPDESGTADIHWIVIAVVFLIVLGIVYLAFEVARRSRRAGANVLTSTAPARSARDDDPLSRGATEWEKYAEQLAADGRYREAIRAWYHAVLVTCYASGVLHFRKGRTNWEYIASLPPVLSWRAELIGLTRRFEVEWYGHEQSTADALEECSERARAILDSLHEERLQRGAA
jgi:hypothetical protein